MPTLEQLRQLHEEIDTLKVLSSAALQSRASPSEPHPALEPLSSQLRTSLDFEHLTSHFLESARSHAQQLHVAYSQTESHALPQPTRPVTDPLSHFYARLRDLRDAHRALNPDRPPVPLWQQAPPARVAAVDAQLLQRLPPPAAAFEPPQFSGDEASGSRLDLQRFYTAYVNLTRDTALTFATYARTAITSFSTVPRTVRATSTAYAAYLADLLAYLRDFAARVYPLDDTPSLISAATDTARKEILTELAQYAAHFGGDGDALLTKHGAPHVTDALAALGLKCGGRPEERAKRLLAAARDARYEARALDERVVAFMLDELLAEQRARTVEAICKKQAQSFAELDAERRLEEVGGGASVAMDGMTAAQHQQRGDGDTAGDDVDDGPIYNPKDIPLGWDGKPIPYWMFKLHGLNHEFRCEICGGATYKGPRAFERHFSDGVHVAGLRRLGISYSKAFCMITRIDDAMRLQRRIEQRERDVTFDAATEVEVEDEYGNVLPAVAQQ